MSVTVPAPELSSIRLILAQQNGTLHLHASSDRIDLDANDIQQKFCAFLGLFMLWSIFHAEAEMPLSLESRRRIFSDDAPRMAS
jgi:hypothetical protein